MVDFQLQERERIAHEEAELQRRRTSVDSVDSVVDELKATDRPVTSSSSSWSSWFRRKTRRPILMRRTTQHTTYCRHHLDYDRSVDELKAKTSELEDEARAWRRQSESLLAAEEERRRVTQQAEVERDAEMHRLGLLSRERR